MIKKVVKFFDSHRIILVLLTLLILSILFISLKVIIFLNHNFKPLLCTNNIDSVYCYHNEMKIFKEPEDTQKEFFKENKDSINDLIKKYNLPDFNKYTSYYYEVVAMLNYDLTGTNKNLYEFFETYNNTYNIKNFYKTNNFYYEIFYPYKIF